MLDNSLSPLLGYRKDKAGHHGNMQLLQEPLIARQNGCNTRQPIRGEAGVRHWSRSLEEGAHSIRLSFSLSEDPNRATEGIC